MNHRIAHVRPDACDQVLVPQTQHHVLLYKMVSALSNQAKTFAVANKVSRRAVRRPRMLGQLLQAKAGALATCTRVTRSKTQAKASFIIRTNRRTERKSSE